MPLLSDFFTTPISGNQRAIEDALAAAGKEIKPLEHWISQNKVNGDAPTPVLVGKEQIESDPQIYEKAYSLIVKLQDELDIKWNDEFGIDLHKTSVDFLVLKYVIAAGMGLQFNQLNAPSYPLTAKLASLDLDALNEYFQESFDTIQNLYKKYFK